MTSALAPEKAKWYELDWLIPYRDLIGLLGLGLITGGVYKLLSLGAAMVVAGLGMLAVSYLAGKYS